MCISRNEYFENTSRTGMHLLHLCGSEMCNFVILAGSCMACFSCMESCCEDMALSLLVALHMEILHVRAYLGEQGIALHVHAIITN